jgi:hypothetical protein
VVELHTIRERGRKQDRLAVGQEVHVRLDAVVRGFARPQDPERHPRVVRRHGDVDGGAVTDLLTLRLRGVGVEDRGHEDRAACGVEVEDLGSVRGETEAVLRGPASDGLAAALEDGDVERVDLDLHQHLRVLARARSGRRREQH